MRKRQSVAAGIAYLIWFILAFSLFIQRCPDDSFPIAENIRKSITRDCPYSHYPLQYMKNIGDWSDWGSFAARCWVAYTFNNASWAVNDGNTATPNTPYVESTAWNWPGVLLQDPTMERTGPMMVWQVRDKVGTNDGRLGPFNFTHEALDQPLRANMTAGRVYVPYQDLSSNFIAKFNTYPTMSGMGGQYDLKGYFYNIFVDSSLADVITLSSPQHCLGDLTV